jgi:hypothetical protein
MVFSYSLALLAHFQPRRLGFSSRGFSLCRSFRFYVCRAFAVRYGFPSPFGPYLPVGCQSLHSPCGLFVGTPPPIIPVSRPCVLSALSLLWLVLCSARCLLFMSATLRLRLSLSLSQPCLWAFSLISVFRLLACCPCPGVYKIYAALCTHRLHSSRCALIACIRHAPHSSPAFATVALCAHRLASFATLCTHQLIAFIFHSPRATLCTHRFSNLLLIPTWVQVPSWAPFLTNFGLFAFLRLRSDIRSPFLFLSLCSCSTGRIGCPSGPGIATLCAVHSSPPFVALYVHRFYSPRCEPLPSAWETIAHILSRCL